MSDAMAQVPTATRIDSIIQSVYDALDMLETHALPDAPNRRRRKLFEIVGGLEAAVELLRDVEALKKEWDEGLAADHAAGVSIASEWPNLFAILRRIVWSGRSSAFVP